MVSGTEAYYSFNWSERPLRLPGLGRAADKSPGGAMMTWLRRATWPRTNICG